MPDPDPQPPDLEALRLLPAAEYVETLRPLTWRASRQPWELEKAAAALVECRRILAGGCPGRPVDGEREAAEHDQDQEAADG